MADSGDGERLLLLLLLFILIRRRRRLQRNQVRRRLWVRGVFLKRKSQGEFGNLVRELRASDRELYFWYVVSFVYWFCYLIVIAAVSLATFVAFLMVFL